MAAFFLLILLTVPTSSASFEFCLPPCNLATWSDCVQQYSPITRFRDYQTAVYRCIACKKQKDAVANDATPVPTVPCHLRHLGTQTLVITGYPFHVLSAKSLPVQNRSEVHALFLFEAEIETVEENTVSEFSFLGTLGLDFNRLSHVQQSWFPRLEELSVLSLSNNRIEQIDPGCFKNLPNLLYLNLEHNLLQVVDAAWFYGQFNIGHLYMDENSLSCLDGELIQGINDLNTFAIGGNRLITVRDEVAHRMAWSLAIDRNMFLGHIFVPRPDTITVEVPNFHLCVRNDPELEEISVAWDFDSKETGHRHMPCSKYVWDINKENSLASEPPFVVIATSEAEPEENLHYPDMCRQVWKHNLGITVALKGSRSLQLVSIGVGNTDIGIMFVNTQDSEMTSAPYSNDISNSTIHESTDHTETIRCILLNKHNPSAVVDVPRVQKQMNRVCPVHNTDTEEAASLTSSPSRRPSTEEYSLQTPTGQTTKHLVTNHLQNTSASEAYIIPVAFASTVGILIFSLFVGLLLTKCLQRNNMDPRDAHVWTLSQDDTFSSRPLPANLQHTYHDIPDNIAAAQRSLPALPHTYYEIPDNKAVAQRPLPALPHTYEGMHDSSTAGRPLSTPSHAYQEIPDHAVSSRPGRVVSDTRLTESCRSLPAALYFVEATDRSVSEHCHVTVSESRAVANGVPGKARHNWFSVYSPWEVPENGQRNIVRRRSLPTLPNTYWPWSMPGEESQATGCQEPLVSILPNTYWPWEIPAKGNQNVERRRSLPIIANKYSPRPSSWEERQNVCQEPSVLSNTHVPLEVEVKSVPNFNRRRSLPTLPNSNTYLPVLSGEGSQTSVSLHPSLPTLPNTYWPWEIPEKGTYTKWRSFEPTLPIANTYLPVLSVEGYQTSVSLRPSIPTLPNTYWQWEIPEKGTYTKRQSFEPTLPIANTYWPWQTTGEGPQTSKSRRSSIPTLAKHLLAMGDTSKGNPKS
uniref:LRRCT domain-containing protein n=1 Tax=Branchiostoma floridae TaxID=7739 RepID=C3Z113_BRAFL|eukprot:XP_002597700.1 hypothetical protein BRAFLDRAFT_77396 [Branchiostoma floridae]